MMFGNKKGHIMRHPYATLAIIGLAAAGAMSIGEKVKDFVSDKAKCVGNMMNGMKHNY